MDLMQYSKKLKYLVFTLFLGIQMYFVISYYTQDYPWDERFAWRMFSTVRKLQCVPKAWVAHSQGQYSCPDHNTQRCTPVRFAQDVHMVWYNLLKRGRQDVVQAWVKRICQRPDTHALYFSLTCPDPAAPHPMRTIVSTKDNACDSLVIHSMTTSYSQHTSLEGWSAL